MIARTLFWMNETAPNRKGSRFARMWMLTMWRLPCAARSRWMPCHLPRGFHVVSDSPLNFASVNSRGYTSSALVRTGCRSMAWARTMTGGISSRPDAVIPSWTPARIVSTNHSVP